MNLIVIDIVPALLTWEGRDASGAGTAPGAREALEDLYAGFRLAAVADGDRPAAVIRDVLDVTGLAEVFESLGTSAGYGPIVSARVVRRLASALGVPTRHVIVVTARSVVADAVKGAGITTIRIEGPEGFAEVPEIVADLLDGPLSP